jgi:small subunit ribosomal protein S1
MSQLDLHHVDNPATIVGQRLQFRITRLEGSGRHLNLVVSRRVLLEEEQRARATETRARLRVGLVLQGTVTSLKDYGAFVDIGGLEGLLHVSELGFGRIGHPKDVLAVGQPVEVQVIKIEKDKLSLSLKSLARDPWLDATERYRAGERVRSVVVRTEPFGVFLELEPGVEGLLHKSQLGDAPPRSWKAGQSIEVTVLAVEVDQRRISLSLEPPESDPEGPSSAGRPGFGTLGDLLKKKR